MLIDRNKVSPKHQEQCIINFLVTFFLYNSSKDPVREFMGTSKKTKVKKEFGILFANMSKRLTKD